MKEAIEILERELARLRNGGRADIGFYEDYDEYLKESSAYYRGLERSIGLLRRQL